MIGQTAIFNALSADSLVVSLISTVNGWGCIAVGSREPDTWGPKDSTISIYSASPVDHSLEYLSNTITANCRAETEGKALTLAAAVVTALNRKDITGGGRFYCSTLPVIPPLDETDSFNVPVEIVIKGQRSLL